MAEPEVTHALDGDVARLTLTGELTGAARRPLMRVLTDLLLQVQTLHRVELDLHGPGPSSWCSCAPRRRWSGRCS
jgi:stage II sporulation protein AA (anti-sigma F factor antagonist)